LETLRRTGIGAASTRHGEPVPDLSERVDEILDHQIARKEYIQEMLTDMGTATAYRLMGELLPDLPATEAFPGMSEVISHLDLLEDGVVPLPLRTRGAYSIHSTWIRSTNTSHI
jgi:hypothetical protein